LKLLALLRLRVEQRFVEPVPYRNIEAINTFAAVGGANRLRQYLAALRMTGANVDAVGASTGDALSPTIAFNELVNSQDFAVSVRVQRGVASRSFTGAYHTDMEKYAQRFVKQYREDLG